MNYDQLQKNLNQSFKLRPPALRQTIYGKNLAVMDDTWILRKTAKVFEVINIRTDHILKLTSYVIKGYDCCTPSGKPELRLRRWIMLQGDNILVGPVI